MKEGQPHRKPNPQEKLTRAMQETTATGFVPYSWTGTRVPERLKIIDPTDPEEQKVLVDIPVGYMRDGMMFARGGGLIGAYERIIDFEEQPDGSHFNAILVHPFDPEKYEAAISYYRRLKEKRYQVLPPANVAIIRGKSAEGTGGDYHFSVQIGEVIHRQYEYQVQQDRETGRATIGFVIPIGEFAGWASVKPLDKDLEVDISVEAFNETPPQKVTLTLRDRFDRRYRPLRTAVVDSSLFTEEGFDLDQENIHNHGVVLNRTLSQLLYDFQLGQGQFAPESQPND